MVNELFFDIWDSKGKKAYYQNKWNYINFEVKSEILIFIKICLFITYFLGWLKNIVIGRS